MYLTPLSRCWPPTSEKKIDSIGDRLANIENLLQRLAAPDASSLSVVGTHSTTPSDNVSGSCIDTATDLLFAEHPVSNGAT